MATKKNSRQILSLQKKIEKTKDNLKLLQDKLESMSPEKVKPATEEIKQSKIDPAVTP